MLTSVWFGFCQLLFWTEWQKLSSQQRPPILNFGKLLFPRSEEAKACKRFAIPLFLPSYYYINCSI